MKMRKWLLSTAVASALCAGPALADEIVFNNGDKITGKIVSADGGTLVINTAVAGEVKVNLKDVKTFSTDEPLEIRLSDGTTIKQKIAAGDAGTFSLAPGGALQPQAVPLTSVDKINPPPVKWTGNIAAGLLISQGNVDSEQYNLSLEAVRRADKDRITVTGSYIFGTTEDADGNDVTTNDAWKMTGKYDYFVDKKWYLFAGASFEKDRVANLDLRFVPSGGVGYQWVERPGFNFSTEAGIAWVYEDYRNADSEDFIAAKLAYHVDYAVNDQVTLFHNLTYLPSLEDISDYNIIADAGVRASLTRSMFAEAKIVLDYDPSPAPGSEDLNTKYIASVGWKF